MFSNINDKMCLHHFLHRPENQHVVSQLPFFCSLPNMLKVKQTQQLLQEAKKNTNKSFFVGGCNHGAQSAA